MVLGQPDVPKGKKMNLEVYSIPSISDLIIKTKTMKDPKDNIGEHLHDLTAD